MSAQKVYIICVLSAFYLSYQWNIGLDSRSVRSVFSFLSVQSQIVSNTW
ncbi:hypothetical protein CH379_016755 [Leptospira ellisii]|uniref:Uncharacterized protein n=1 Tax=Leptospira ellisii TaxID=2023197 RepID=A0AAE4QRE5_9LEPT|nr:hypothetical protein [Leptospira ellisii]MDV6237285.1 hypothetical protein [Leptospira ellisii]